MHRLRRSLFSLLAVGRLLAADQAALTLERSENVLIIRGARIPGGELRVDYLEAYCRGNSSNADWVKHTVIPHQSTLVAISPDRKTVCIEDVLADGVTVEHTITAGDDEVDFRLVVHNPTAARSEAQWAQVCNRLGNFTGFTAPLGTGNPDDYLPHCFIFLDGGLARMPVRDWATTARYVPGQVWRGPNAPLSDLNPRPLNPHLPSNGLIGAFSADEKTIFATAWEPYQELFQGVLRCVHADMRIGGLEPGATKLIRGKIYLVPNDVPALLGRYRRDFPEQVR